MARRATLIKWERAKAEHVLVLDAGASLLNDKDPAKETRGRTSIEAMNLMGYDALTLGLSDLKHLTTAELWARMAEAEFPILSANAFISGTEELLAEPYALIPMADHVVAVLGLTDLGELDGLTISDPVETAQRWVPELRAQAGIVILLSHAGVPTDKEIARKVVGIDVIVSGRTVVLSEPFVAETGTIIVHADVARLYAAGENAGIARLTFTKSGRLATHEWRKVRLTSDFPEDQEMSAWRQSLLPAGS